jgi:chorismate-pyruvate lyase
MIPLATGSNQSSPGPARIVRTKPLAECATPHEALSELCAGFAGAENLTFDCQEVMPEEMPSLPRQLLVHQKHMTRTLHAHYGTPVDVHVQERHQDDNLYSRKIFLTLEETPLVVEHGLVRMDFRYMSAKVKASILEEHAPLGSILINQNVLRRIQPRWYLTFPRGSLVLEWFNCQTAGPLYGRLGTIYCNHEPAIELLEIVTAIQGRQS